QPQKGVIVFSVSDSDDVVRRQFQLIQCNLQAGRFVHSGRQHHHGALVEDDLQLESQLPDRFQHSGFVRLPSGHDHAATWEPHETRVLEAIRELGLELQVIFNKGAVMVLPAGVNKATGLQVALNELELSAHNVVGVGDAENDHAFLRL